MKTYFIEGIEVPEKTFLEYIEKLINKIFKILPIYEDCASDPSKDFTMLLSYIDKIIIMLTGSEFLFKEQEFIELVSILEGIKTNIESMTQKKIKSLVFHCIDLLKKIPKIK